MSRKSSGFMSLPSPLIFFLLLNIFLALWPLSIHAEPENKSGPEPRIDGHLLYFPIPAEISKEDFRSPSEALKARLHGLVKRYLTAVQNQNVEMGRDLVVVFTDSDGQPILPDRDALRKRMSVSELGHKLEVAEVSNELNFTFDSPQYPWTAGELASLQTELNDFYQTAKVVYGNPAFNISVNVRQDPMISYSGLYFPSLNEMVLKSAQSDVICHEMIHAFRDDYIIGLTSYEEGMTRAAEIEVFDRLAAYSSWDESHAYSFDVFYEELNSPSIGSQSGNFFLTNPNTLLLLRYELAGYAWAKPLLENSSFLAGFNQEYYSRMSSDPATSGNESKLLEIAIKVQPMVEGRAFLDWYQGQGVLNTNPPVGYFLHHRPDFTVDFFRRNTWGTETMQPNATIQWAVYDFQDHLLASGKGVTTSYGWMSFNPSLPAGYEGRIKVKTSVSTPEGLISNSYDTIVFGQHLSSQAIFGVTPYYASGSIEITFLDNPSSKVTMPIVNGAFSVPNYVETKGRFFAKLINPSGQTFSKYFNKDASSYFLLAPSPGLCTVRGGGYTSIQAAYNAAANGDTIQCQEGLFDEDLAVNRSITVTLEGGYDAGFISNAGRKTTLKGMITTTKGKITISNFSLGK